MTMTANENDVETAARGKPIQAIQTTATTTASTERNQHNNTMMNSTTTTTTTTTATATADTNEIAAGISSTTSTTSATTIAAPPDQVAASETKLLTILRLVLLLVLVSVTILVSLGVYRITRQDEQDRFQQHVHVYARRILDDFQYTIAQRLGAIHALATAMTSHAMATNQSFPYFTMPDFALHGSVLRVQARSHAVNYMPVVYDYNRLEWETYAAQHRFQMDEAYLQDEQQRAYQDYELGYIDQHGSYPPMDDEDDPPNDRILQQPPPPPPSSTTTSTTETILDDGTGYHVKIWSIGALTPRGDEPPNRGPYLPLWQTRYGECILCIRACMHTCTQPCDDRTMLSHLSLYSYISRFVLFCFAFVCLLLPCLIR